MAAAVPYIVAVFGAGMFGAGSPLLTAIDYFLCVLGMAIIIEGVPYFAFPDKVKACQLRAQAIPVPTLRLFGFASMAVGLLLICFGRR